MLTPRQVATIRAALLFWQEEMCPHGSEVMLPYLEPSDIEALNTAETAELRDRLSQNLRYAVYDSTRERLDGPDLFLDAQEAELAAGSLAVATVLIPAPLAGQD